MHRSISLGAYVLAVAALFVIGVSADETAVKLTSSVKAPGQLGESLRNEANVAVRKGLDWLVSSQRPDGSWSDTNFPALTALAVWPFIQSDHPAKAEVIRKATSFLRSFVQKDGGIYRDIPGRKGGGLSNYNTAICMTVLHATGNPELTTIVQNARAFLAGTQHFGDDEYNGGFGYDKDTKRAYTDLLNTYYTVQAMRLTQDVEDKRPAGEKKADINWAETVKFIERMQNKPESGDEDSGGFTYNPTDPKGGPFTNQAGKIVFRSYGSITYAGMLALVYANVSRDDVRVVSALDWASKHWTVEENPGMGQEGLFFFYSVLTRALSAAQVDMIQKPGKDFVDWRAEVVKKVVSLQKIENGLGYWMNDVNRYWESDRILVTAYSLMALQMAMK